MVLYNIKKIISKKPRLGIFLTKIKTRLPYPLFLLMHITLECNRHCSWCYQRQDLFYEKHSANMPIKAFEKILSSLKQFVLYPKPHIHLFGGEPLCHAEFSDFLKICKKYKFSPTITTNGDYLDRYIDIIKNSSVTQLNITLNRPLYNSLERTYGLLISFIDFLTRDRNKIVNLSYTITPSEYYLLEETVLFFNKRFKNGVISSFTCQHLMMKNKCSDSEEKRINIDILANQIKQLQKEKINFKLLFLPYIALQDLYKYYYSDYQFRNKCYIPWTGLSIYPDLVVAMGGGVLGCNKAIGDLNIESLQQIWEGKRISSWRDSLLINGLEEQCNRCCQKLYY